VVSGARRRVGVFGSLCNPPHVGHLVLCQEARAQLDLERVVVVPTGVPPHRAAPAEPAELRLRLAEAAVAGDPGLGVSRVELDRPGPSYMSDTLRELAHGAAGGGLVLLLGADQLAGLRTWHQAALLPRLAAIAAARRPGVESVEPDGVPVEWLAMPALEISSSDLRARVAAGRPIRHLVPDAVRELIEAEGLYRSGAGG
jgi:nicotinate-nucleotide adenylyltransferase